MDPQRSSLERERAFESFVTIVETHMAALQALSLISAMPDAETFLAAQIKMRRGMPAGSGANASDDAAEFLRTARAERERGFSTMRSLTLVAVCGALEYLIKATLVDQAANDPDQAAALLISSKVKLPASAVMRLTEVERWFVVADQLFKDLGEGNSSMHRRAVRFLTEFAHLPMGDEQRLPIMNALNTEETRRFDDAFLIRNCLVHNGGRVSSSLARSTGRTRNSLITLDQDLGAPMILAVRKFAQAVNSIWHGAL